ncbi:MAG: exodeoxyribonuclease III [Oligoflexia bacterium]|nr:exodeoxyribonuclease III [Oligoflexia bacterium]
MKLVCWNVNGFRSALSKGLLDFVASQAPDVLCLQEVKASPDVLEDARYKIPGFRLYHSCATKKGYSGVATWLRDGLPEPSEVLHGIERPVFDHEGRVLILRLKDFDLYNIYFPSGTTGDTRQAFKYRFLDALSDYIVRLPAQQKNRIVMCGDFNICHREIDIHHPQEATKRELSGFLPDERLWMDYFTALGFVDTFRHVHGDTRRDYSWWSFRAGSRKKNLGWRIDYFFVAKTLVSHVRSADILTKIMGSDHCPITLELQANRP